MKRLRDAGLVLALLAFTVAFDARPGRPAGGVVVEEVAKGGEAERAGIRPGDVLISWERPANPPANARRARGAFLTPFDVLETWIDQSPRARALTLHFRRGGEPRSAAVLPYTWGLETRPSFSGGRVTQYETGRRWISQGDVDKGVEAWQALAAELATSRDHLGAAWVWLRIAQRQAAADRIDPALASFDLSLAQARAAERADVESQVLGYEGTVLSKARRFTESEAALRQALATRERREPAGLAVAYSLEELNRISEPRGSAYDEAQRRALRIRQSRAPGSAAEAASLRDLAISTYFRGDLRKAVELQKDSLAIHRQISSTSWRVGYAINNVCGIETERGNLAVAEQLCEQSLTLSRGYEGEKGLELASASLVNMGEIAIRRGDLEAAKQFQLRALALREQYAGSEGIGWNLTELGDVALRAGDFAEAERLFQRAEKLLNAERRPNSGVEASFRRRLAETAYRRGDLAGAVALLRQAAALVAQLDPNGAQAAEVCSDLGQVLGEVGQTAEAESQLRRALVIRRGQSPESRSTAESSHSLGMLLWKTGRLAEAEVELRTAVEDVESQLSRLGGSQETLSGFAADVADIYRDYLRLLMELHREQDAFHLLERYRAGSFLRTLAQRDFGPPAEVPPALEAERRAVNAEYEQVQGEILGLNSTKQAKDIETAIGRLAELRRKQTEIAQTIRRDSERYGELRDPRPLDLAGSRAALESGTLLISYAVGPRQTYLFAALPDAAPGRGLFVYPLPVGEKELRESVDAFRRLIGRKASSPELVASSRALYELLLAPAESLIASSDRLLVVPDGPLHKLPWSALSRDADGRRQYLAEWKPISTSASATVYAELKKAPRASPGDRSVVLAAFGDPVYPTRVERSAAVLRSAGDAAAEIVVPPAPVADDEDPELLSVSRGGFAFEPLPASRLEVERIAALYAPNAATYLGTDATEEKAKSIGPGVRLIHYACHALINGRFPLDSALVFTLSDKPLPGRDNGLLQAWEIFESVQINADLVTLSACESGLGKEAGGEGLIGLTRAFEFAGAHSVLASLWKVDDRATAELMKRFYGHLRAGRAKNEALRLAQTEMIRSPEWSSPFAWAAFQLDGDWK